MSLVVVNTAPSRAATPAWRVRLSHEWRGESWPPGDGTVFQRAPWLTPLYAAIAAREPQVAPLVVRLEDGDGVPALQLPLLLRPLGRRIALEFADLGMTDFNMPLLGPAAPADARAARGAWAALRRALPPHDLVRFTKMPVTLAGRPNPLALLPGVRPCAVNGNLVVMTGDWTAFHFGLERTVRKELERSWRVFEKTPGARLRTVTDSGEARHVLTTMDTLQRARMAGIGQPFTLDDPVTADFYRRLMAGLGDHAILTVLEAEDELVSALLGVRDGETFVMIRLAHAADAWRKVSPGRLLIHKTLEMLHGQGLRRFDFSVGNYAYKRRFGPTRTPLVDYCEARTLSGLVPVLRAEAGARLRRHPKTHARVRRLLGKPPSREED